MQYVSCEKGHFYNPEEHAACPQCAREAMQGGFSMDDVYSIDAIGPTEPGNDLQSGLGPTEPINGPQGADTYGPTEPINGPQGMDTYGPTEPANGWQAGTAQKTATGDAFSGQIQDYGPTTPIGPGFKSVAPGSQQIWLQPVVGWLVCVEGPAKGRDFRIHSQNNYIGRGRDMDICIEGDSSISAANAAILAYDDRNRLFFFLPGQGRNLVWRNNNAVLTPEKLEAYDRLTIGNSDFLFIPLCGERFDWNEQEA